MYFVNLNILLFLLTCLLRGMTDYSITLTMSDMVSTHMPLARHDFFRHVLPSFYLLFLLTCLLRGMTTLPGIR